MWRDYRILGFESGGFRKMKLSSGRLPCVTRQSRIKAMPGSILLRLFWRRIQGVTCSDRIPQPKRCLRPSQIMYVWLQPNAAIEDEFEFEDEDDF